MCPTRPIDLRTGHHPDTLEFLTSLGTSRSLKHADATTVEVTLGRQNGSLLIEITDDGVGFAPTVADGYGLGNLAARLEALGGGLTVDSRPGDGTAVRATVSLADQPDPPS